VAQIKDSLTTVILMASSNCCIKMLTHAEASSSRISGSLNYKCTKKTAISKKWLQTPLPIFAL